MREREEREREVREREEREIRERDKRESFWWESDSYIFIPASGEKGICTFLYQLLVRKRFVHFYTSF